MTTEQIRFKQFKKIIDTLKGQFDYYKRLKNSDYMHHLDGMMEDLNNRIDDIKDIQNKLAKDYELKQSSIKRHVIVYYSKWEKGEEIESPIMGTTYKLITKWVKGCEFVVEDGLQGFTDIVKDINTIMDSNIDGTTSNRHGCFGNFGQSFNTDTKCKIYYNANYIIGIGIDKDKLEKELKNRYLFDK